jgi:glycosyltransferase involved in cell wall biosynthesis
MRARGERGVTPKADALVSIVIPCYNQQRFLGDALASARLQSYEPIQVIVVDDGSTEDVASTVWRRAGVQFIREPNSGVASARNIGFLYSRGRYVVFLDSDDRLAPDAIAEGVAVLQANRDAGAAVGRCRMIGPAGEPRPIWGPSRRVHPDAYLELLRGNFIWMPAQVMYRRDAFVATGGFDGAVDACADYDLYLRMARMSRLAVHRRVVADYRRHEDNMSSDASLMLRFTLAVLDRQEPYIGGHERYRRALAAGRRFWKEFYGGQLVETIRREARTPGRRLRALQGALALLRYDPARFAWHAGRKVRCLARDLVTGSGSGDSLLPS